MPKKSARKRNATLSKQPICRRRKIKPKPISAWHLRQAARVFYAGGLIAYPTEAVFGLGCDPNNLDAVARLLALKNRPVENGLILLASDMAQLELFVDFSAPVVSRRVQATWPGPITWCVPKRENAPLWISGSFDTIAVRVTAHAPARALCEAIGSAIVSTSLNRSGQRPAISALGSRSRFPGDLDCIIHAETGHQGRPTEIRHAVTGARLRSG